MMIANPKLKTNRSSILKWLKYHASFSEHFVTSILSNLKSDGNYTILDQFIGSGTTAVSALRSEIINEGYGYDLNPVSVLVSQIICSKENNFIGLMPEIEIFLENIRIEYSEKGGRLYLTNLKPFISNVKISIESSITKIIYQKIALLAFSMVIKDLSVFTEGSNPSWIKINRPSNLQYITYSSFSIKFIDRIKRIISDLEKERNIRDELNPRRNINFTVELTNAKNLPLKGNSIDINITSPPYLSRIDYVKQVLGEINVIGSQDIHWISNLREEMMGTVKIRKNVKELRDEKFGRLTSSLLNKIEKHPSKASDIYYNKFHFQYFQDLYQSLEETYRVLEDNGIAYWVVQNSYYKELEINLSKIIQEMTTTIGFSSFKNIHTHLSKTHLGLLSPNQRKWIKNKQLKEYVIEFVK